MPETQHNGQAGPGYGRRVKIRYSRQINRCVVSTRELATIIAHSHPNLTQAVRRLLDKRPELVGEFLVGQYVAANRQRYTCYEVAAGGLAGLAERLHNVPGCNDVRARLDNIRVGLMVMDEQMARGEPGPEEVSPDAEAMTLPAPDSEIRPPEPEPAETLQPVALDLRTEPGGPLEHARRVIEAYGVIETPEMLAKVLLALPPGGAQQAAPEQQPEPASWEINAALETLKRGRAPVEGLDIIEKWNYARCASLLAWIYGTKAPH